MSTILQNTSAGLRQIARHIQVPLFSNAYFLILTNLIPSASGFFFWALVARLMPAQEVGWGSALLSVTALLVSLFGLDLGTGLIRYVPMGLEQSPDRVNTAVGIRSLLAGVAAAVFLAGVSLWSPALLPVRSTAIGVTTFLLGNVAMSINELLEHIFVAYRSAKYALLKGMIVSLGRFPVLFLLATFESTRNGFGIYLSTGLAAAAANVICLLWFLPRTFPPYRFRLNVTPRLFADMARYSFKNYVASLLLQLPGLVVPILVINSAPGPAGAGVAYVASMMAWVVLVIPAAVSRSLLAEASHDNERLAYHARRAVVFSFLLMSLPVTILATAGPMLLGLLFGPLYQQQGAGLLVLTALSALPGGLFSVYVSLKRAKHETRELITTVALVSVVSLGLGAALMARWGLNGLGVGLLVGQLTGAGLAAREILLHTRSSRPIGQPTDYSSLKRTLICIVTDISNKLAGAPRILDVGCGTGVLTSRLRTLLGGQSYGVDVDEPPLRFAAAQYSQSVDGFTRYDGYRLPFAPTRFNLIVLNEVIEHVPDPVRLLTDLFQVAVPGGWIVLTTPNAALHPFSVDAHPDHVTHYTVAELRHMVECAGWQVADQFYRYHPLSNWLDQILLRGARASLPIQNIQAHMAVLERPAAHSLLVFYHNWIDPLIGWIEQTEFRLRKYQPGADQVCLGFKPCPGDS